MSVSDGETTSYCYSDQLFHLMEWLNSLRVVVPMASYTSDVQEWWLSMVTGQPGTLELDYTDLTGAALPLDDATQGWNSSMFPVAGDYDTVVNTSPKFWKFKFEGDVVQEVYGADIFTLMEALLPVPAEPEPDPESPMP